MRQWWKRAGYVVFILLWLILVSFPVAAFFLATQGEIRIGDNSSGLRLFMLQESDNQGLGIQWTRSIDDPNQESAVCSQTSLRYLLWEGDAAGQSSDYCQCFDPETQDSLPLDSCSLP
jgi:hypothetical protein